MAFISLSQKVINYVLEVLCAFPYQKQNLEELLFVYFQEKNKNVCVCVCVCVHACV